jgi:uncharacterized protein (TIGR02217 family)
MTIPTFIDTHLNVDVEQGATGGPSFLTTVMALSGGQEKRNIEWQFPRQEWDISFGIQTAADFQSVRDMFYNTFGRAIGFRFKDWTDYTIGDPVDYVAASSQPIGTFVSGNKIFQIYKTYTIGSYSMIRKITRPVQGTLKVYIDNILKTETTDYTVDYTTGIITFVATHDTHTASVSLEYDVPVRFDSDLFKMKVTWVDAMELPSIAIIELKE